MIASTESNFPAPSAEAYVLLHHRATYLVSAVIVPLDFANSRLFADWDLEHWERLRKLQWYRRPFVLDLLQRQQAGQDKTFLLLTRLDNFPALVWARTGQDPGLDERVPPLQVQAALTVQTTANGSVTIYNIETAPWNKFAPDKRFFSLPAAALFFYAAAQLYRPNTGGRFILSHPTDDGVLFYQEKLKLDLRWRRGLDTYAVVEPASLARALQTYRRQLARWQQTLPLYR